MRCNALPGNAAQRPAVPWRHSRNRILDSAKSVQERAARSPAMMLYGVVIAFKKNLYALRTPCKKTQRDALQRSAPQCYNMPCNTAVPLKKYDSGFCILLSSRRPAMP